MPQSQTTARGAIQRGELLTIEIATLVGGGFQVTACYAGGLREDSILDDVGRFDRLEDVAVAIPTIPLTYEE